MNLPDGSIKRVTQYGDVNLTSKLALQKVLYVPSFKFNLIYVRKLFATAQVKFTFYPAYCVLQDLRTDEVLMKGRIMVNLYVFDELTSATNDIDISLSCIDFDILNCNEPDEIRNNTFASSNDISDNSNCNYTKVFPCSLHLWHMRPIALFSSE